MKNIFKILLRVFVWIVLLSISLIFFGNFLVEATGMIFSFLLSIFLWLVIFFKRKLVWFLLTTGVFLAYFLIPRRSCGEYLKITLPPMSECNCLGVKKIKNSGVIECIGKVSGWKIR